jgi:hypothetical protein
MAIDASGSMYDLADDVRGGFNQYIEDLRTETLTADADDESRNHYKVTVALFNTAVWYLCRDAELAAVPVMDRSNYTPDRGTALLDAIGELVGGFRKMDDSARFRRTPADGDKILVVVNTDGRENSSTEWNNQGVRNLIDAQPKPQWGFVFLGAGPNVWQQGNRLGFASGMTVNTRAGTRSSYSTFHLSTQKFAGGQSVPQDIADDAAAASQTADADSLRMQTEDNA